MKPPEVYAEIYKQRLTEKCRALLNQGKRKCEAAFQIAYDKCFENVPAIVNYIICLPMKIDFICGVENVFSNVVNICNPSTVIDSRFGSEYVKLKEMERKFTMHYGNISINYTTADVRKTIAMKSINETRQIVSKKLQEKADHLDRIIYYVEKLMVFIYIKVIYGTFQFSFSSIRIVRHTLGTGGGVYQY